MRTLRKIGTTLLLVLALDQALPAADEFPFKAGDRVMFLGDSITEQYQYSTDVELYLATRYPAWKLSFLNAGIGGDTATGGAGRFQSQVLDEKPTVVTINFGMNDGGYGAFNEAGNKRYVENTDKMLKMSKDAGVRVVLMSPNAVDPRRAERFKLYLETQKQFYAPLKDLAAQNGAVFVDQYAITRTSLEKMAADKADQAVPFPDGFHTGPSGGLFMAHAILTGLKAPAVVSDVAVPAAGEAQATRCTVTNFTRTGNVVAFDRLDEGLPMPIHPDWDSVLPYVNQLKDLNWYGVKIAGLPAGKYSVSIDGAEVAQPSAEELAAGVNLGNLRVGPVFEQAQKVFTAINQKNDIVRGRFGIVRFNPPDWLADVVAERKPKELAKRKQLIDEQQAEIHKLAMPVKHRWEIKPAK